MAFGWKTEYEKTLPAEGLSNWEIIALARQACKDLEWDYLVVDENSFTATTPTHWTLSEEIIRITVKGEDVIFRSKSESLELYEAGRNQKNLEQLLLPAYKKVKQKWSDEQLQNEAAALKAETTPLLTSGSRISSEKMTYGFRDHEVTFSLIALNIVLFTLMVAKGADANAISVSDLINWGANVNYNVTGGEWWRLLTANFVHPGILPLIVNLFGLYLIGLQVESVLGTTKYLIAFLCAGVIANLASIIWVPGGVNAGASGAIFGMYGVLFAFSTTRYINKKFPKIWLAGVAAYAVFNIIADVQGSSEIAANIGGLLGGIGIGYLFYFFHFNKKVARAGGSRISVEVLLITGLLIFLYLRKSGSDDTMHFEQSVMRLNQIEVKAMGQMQRLQDKTNAEAAKFLRDTALPEWKHFQSEISKTDTYKLDDQFTQKRKLLTRYAGLRVRQTQLIYKSIRQETDKYNAEINKVSDEIDQIIDKLGSEETAQE